MQGSLYGKSPTLACSVRVAGLSFKGHKAPLACQRREEASGGEQDATLSGEREGISGISGIAFARAAGRARALGREAQPQPVAGFAPARELPAPGDLPASSRYVEVHRVAKVAALWAAVHRELVHVQVERL